MFYNNFLTDFNYSFQIIRFEKFCFINPQSFELCNLSTISKCPVFPKYGYNREMEFKFKVNDIYKSVNIDSPLVFDQFNPLKSIYICNKDLTSIFKLSNIKMLDMQFHISNSLNNVIYNPTLKSSVIHVNFDKNDTSNTLEITSTIDISICDTVTDEDDIFLIKTLLLSRS